MRGRTGQRSVERKRSLVEAPQRCARASLRPPGPQAQPLGALLLLPVRWETPDPHGWAGACDMEPGGSGAGDTGRVRRGGHVPGHGAKCREGGGWRDLEAPSGAGSALPPSPRALAEQPEAGKGRREQGSVQHRVQLVGQVIEHVADVLQDVLGRVYGPGGAGEGRESWLNAAPTPEVPPARAGGCQLFACPRWGLPSFAPQDLTPRLPLPQRHLTSPPPPL